MTKKEFLKTLFFSIGGASLLPHISSAKDAVKKIASAPVKYVRNRTFALNSLRKNPPMLQTEGGFSIIVLGDPQSYMKFNYNQPAFELMTSWVAEKKEDLNIQTVLCTGDLVEQNGIVDSNAGSRYKEKNGNVPSRLQWKAVSRAFERFDNIYPYIPVTGNHDYGIEACENRQSEFPIVFNIERNNNQWSKHLVEVANNAFGIPTLENAAFEFYGKNWGNYMIISLEFSPRDEVLDWAKKVCDKFPNYKVFIITHSLMNTKSNLIPKEKYLAAENSGENIFEKLLDKCPNIKFAICGHSATTEIMSKFRVFKRTDGSNMPIMMFNPQAISGWFGNGGDGWLRILEFKPDGKTISARTYSPVFAFSDRTEDLSWDNSPDNKFEFQID